MAIQYLGCAAVCEFGKQLSDLEFTETIDHLLAHPDEVFTVYLSGNKLTDETGVKLALFVARSSTIEWLDLIDNDFGLATYRAMAHALRVNTSLQGLFLRYNKSVDRAHVDAMFIRAFRHNPDRPVASRLHLYSGQNEFERLKNTADELGHLTLQELLLGRDV